MKKLFTILALALTSLSFSYGQQNLSQGGTGWSTSTLGDILVGTSSKLRFTRLPIGTTGQVLWSLGGQPAWVATSSLGISGGGGSLTGGAFGYVTRWLSATTVGTSTFLDDGVVTGINATSSSYTFNVQGNSGVSPFNVASSTGTSLVSVLKTGDMLINNLTVGKGPGGVVTNTVFGNGSLLSNTTGSQNTAVGYQTLADGSTSTMNTAVGLRASQHNVAGAENTAIGTQALQTNTNGSFNTAIGRSSLNSTTGSGNVALGYLAGQYETGSNAFYVDNQERSSTANEKVGSLFYGTFNATAANQTLNINASTSLFSIYNKGFYRDSINASGTLGQVLWSTGTSTLWVSTSTLGISSGGSGTVTSVSMTTPTGLTAASTTCNTACLLNITLTAGYVIPLTASTTQWSNFLNASATLPYYLTFAYASSTFPSFSYASSTFASTTWVTSTFAPKASPTFTGTSTFTDIRLNGGLYDQGNTLGTANQILRSTGTSTQWVATSSLFGTYLTAVTGTYPIIVTGGNAISTGFSTSTINNFTAQNNFSTSSTTASTIGTLYATNTSQLSGRVQVGTTTNTNTAGLVIGTTTQMFAALKGRLVGYASAASTTINIDTTDTATSTINQATTLVNFSGTPYDTQMVQMVLMATTTQGLFWGTTFGSSTDLSLPNQIASGTMLVLVQYDAFRAKWWLAGLLKAFNN